MAVVGSPAPSAGSFIDVIEVYPADGSSAVSVTEPVRLGVTGGVYGTAMTTAAGTANSVTVQASLTLTFVASVAQTIDLTAVPGRAGNKAFTKVHKVRIADTADPTLAGSVVVNATGTNAWTNGPFTATGVTIGKGDELFWSHGLVAGWAVDATHKILTFTPSAHVTTLTLCILGE